MARRTFSIIFIIGLHLWSLAQLHAQDLYPTSWRLGLWSQQRHSPHIEGLLRIFEWSLGIKEMGAQEKDSVKRLLLEEKNDAYLASLAQKNRLLAELELSSLSSEQKSNRLEELENRLKREREELNDLTQQTISFPKDQQTFSYATLYSNEMTVPGSLEEWKLLAQNQELDQVLFIDLAEAPEGSLILAHLILYDRHQEKILLDIYQSFDQNENLPLLLAQNFYQALMERPWAILNVQTSYPETQIWLDGTMLAQGSLFLHLSQAGPHHLRLVAPGHRLVEKTITLHPFETHEENIELSTLHLRLVHLQTLPSNGSDVYLDNIHLGQTPLEITLSSADQVLMIKKEGFENRYLLVKDITESSTTLTLKTLEPDRIHQARRRYYWSLASFTLSLALPVLTYGQRVSSGRMLYLVEEEYQNQTASYQEWIRANQAFRRDNALFWTSVTVNLSALTWMLWEAFRYLQEIENTIIEPQ